MNPNHRSSLEKEHTFLYGPLLHWKTRKTPSSARLSLPLKASTETKHLTRSETSSIRETKCSAFTGPYHFPFPSSLRSRAHLSSRFFARVLAPYDRSEVGETYTESWKNPLERKRITNQSHSQEHKNMGKRVRMATQGSTFPKNFLCYFFYFVVASSSPTRKNSLVHCSSK